MPIMTLAVHEVFGTSERYKTQTLGIQGGMAALYANPIIFTTPQPRPWSKPSVDFRMVG